MKRRGSRRSTKSRRGATKPSRRELALYDGTNFVGVVKVGTAGAYVAYNPRGKRVGVFPSLQAASASLPRPVAMRGGAA